MMFCKALHWKKLVDTFFTSFGNMTLENEN